MEIKFFKKEKNFKKTTFWLNLNLYWKMAVALVLLMAIFSIFFGYFLFVKANKEHAILEGSTSGQVEMIKKERIAKVLEYFNTRKQKFNQILYSSAPVVDSSL